MIEAIGLSHKEIDNRGGPLGKQKVRGKWGLGGVHMSRKSAKVEGGYKIRQKAGRARHRQVLSSSRKLKGGLE